MIVLLAQAASAVTETSDALSDSQASNPTFWGIFALAMGLCVVCVLLHNQVVRLLWVKVHLHGQLALRWSMIITVLTLVIAHLVQIAIFGVTFYLLGEVAEVGRIQGADALIRDYFYFSGVAYTTVGFGDLTPKASLRPLAAVESLMGFVMITWSASFSFLQMQRSWSADEEAQAEEEDEEKKAKRAGRRG